MMAGMARGEAIRLLALGAAVVLEGLAIVSVVLGLTLLPIPGYGHLVSVVVFVLPSLVGFLSRRLAVGLVLAALPFWVLALVDLALFQPIWLQDLFSIGVTVSRAAGASVLLLAVALFGWLVRRVTLGARATGRLAAA